MHNGEAAMALAEVFAELLGDPTQREELGARAKALIEQNRGATIRTMKILTPILTKAARLPVPGNV
jgi:3-deoxy-D-manno-octulosonic-acid transferase